MYKAVLLLKRRPDLASVAFSQDWLDVPWAAFGRRENVLRHVHNRAVQEHTPIENAPMAAFDAVDEYWFRDVGAARSYFLDRAFADTWHALGAPLLSAPPLALSGPAHLLWHRHVARPADPVKIVTLPVRRARMTPEAFGRHWINVHSVLALDGPKTRTRLHRLEPCLSDNNSIIGFPAAPFDGVGTIEFADRSDLHAEFASDYYRNVLAPDEPRFTDPSRSAALMVEAFTIRQQDFV